MAHPRLGRYEVAARLATGGMAEVLVGWRRGPGRFQKRVALKRVLPHLAGEPALVELFLEEARLHAGFDHPHVVQLFELDRDVAGEWFLALELVHGCDAARLLRRAREAGRPLPPVEAALLLLQAAEGLAAVHAAGVVHRDVTPGNLLISFDGVVKVADFGVAKQLGAPPSPRAAAVERRLTETCPGAIKGKIAYMSPEQVRGDPVDARSDVYSLGICGWELVAGRRLFTDRDPRGLFRRVYRSIVRPLSSVRDDLPDELEAILMRALARDPADRYPSMEAFAAALEAFAARRGVVSTARRLGGWLDGLFPPEARHALPCDEAAAPPDDERTPPRAHGAPQRAAGERSPGV